MHKLYIATINEFEECLQKGINPLFWHRYIKLVPELRIKLQYKLFGNADLGIKNIVRANDKYYHYCLNYSSFICENCGMPLYALQHYDCYSSIYVSHIISRGSDARMAHDPRNHNILCAKCHKKWESPQKSTMLIWIDNLVVIEELKKDYNIFS